MTRAERFSYLFIFLVIVLAGALHLATPLVTVLFSYFALSRLSFTKQKWLSVLLFLFVVAGVLYGFGYLVKQTVRALFATLESESLPAMIAYAHKHNIELPFSDFETLKATIMDSAREDFRALGTFARAATKEFVLVLIGVVVGISLFMNPNVETDNPGRSKRNLFTAIVDQIVHRFSCFYESFDMVMGAQLVISALNTALTAIFVLVIHLKHGTAVIGLTFLCGLLPIVGNLISNSIIVAIAFTHSPQAAMAALVFLIALHKLEYFLNSKIIGERIKNPVWLTLLALILGERLMGIPGMILAPVILHYIKIEASKLPAASRPIALAETAESVEK